MKWHSVDEFLPGNGVGYVIARVLNADYCQFIYQAIYSRNGWEFWDEEYFPDGRLKEEGFRITHWTYMPDLMDGGF